MAAKKETFAEFWRREWDTRCPEGVRGWLFAAGAICGLFIIAWIRSAAAPRKWDGKL